MIKDYLFNGPEKILYLCTERQCIDLWHSPLKEWVGCKFYAIANGFRVEEGYTDRVLTVLYKAHWQPEMFFLDYLRGRQFDSIVITDEVANELHAETVRVIMSREFKESYDYRN